MLQLKTKKYKITVLLTTCDRYDSTLPLCLLSILNQTRLPDSIVIVDDSRNNTFYNEQQIKYCLLIAKLKQVPIEYFYGERKGQVLALQLGMDNIEDGWVFKTDDDNVLEPNVLELLEKEITPEYGCIGGVILDRPAMDRFENNIKMSSNVEDIFTHYNIQMIGNQSDDVKEADHIYSNYFFDISIHRTHYPELQPSSHREDTLFTHSIYRKGYKIKICPYIKIHHIQDGLTGNRQFGKEFTDKNERIFIKKLEEWGIIPDKLQIYEDDKRVYTIRDGIYYEVFSK